MPDLQENNSELKESQKMNSRDNANKGPKKRKDDDAMSSKYKKTLKRPSPFRIKVGCVVALRMNPEGNRVSKVNDNGQVIPIMPDDSLIPVWANPINGRDEGLALVGKRVRCFLPKNLVEGKKRRILEGEVTGIQEYMTRSDEKPWKVDLLVDKGMLSEFPFLVRTDEDLQFADLPTEKAKRNARLEETIRGTNKCTVRVRLSQPGSVDGKNSLKWVIQRTVPKRLLQSSPSNGASGAKGKTDTGKRKGDEVDTMDCSDRGTNGSVVENSASEPARKKRKVDQNALKYVGDKEDSPEQQVANWRWMVTRYHDALLKSDDIRWKATEAQMFSIGFVGEVVKVESMPKGSSSLAMVSVRRMILPEHTVSCNSPHCGRADLFDDTDHLSFVFRIPVEELVVLSRKVERSLSAKGVSAGVDEDGTGLVNAPNFICCWGYSSRRDAFIQTQSNGEISPSSREEEFPTCHRCRRPVMDVDTSVECCAGDCALTEAGDRTFFCTGCLRRLARSFPDKLAGSESPPCYLELCDCMVCRLRYSNDMSNAISTTSGRTLKDVTPENVFKSAVKAASSQETLDFGLTEVMLCLSGIPAPSSKPVTRPKNTGQKSISKGSGGKKKNGKSSVKAEKDESAAVGTPEPDDSNLFKPTCARLLTYDSLQSRRKNTFEAPSAAKPERPRNLREHQIEIASTIGIEEKTNQRAERAKQRRLLKGIAAFSSFDLDTLASREPQLRFGRSSIHAWGVFADKDVSSGDMIVEYRGEIIENAMAEKRERLYEAAKIGSDYMFRIDARFVCDATKVGNVARFINASCDPNCYTKIINVDGQKRIVIYAKKDIAAGEELCYDYKFPLEYNPAKRIPCHCGASNCRGFMNWNKKYVVVGNTESQTTDECGPKQDEGKSPMDNESPAAIESAKEDRDVPAANSILL